MINGDNTYATIDMCEKRLVSNTALRSDSKQTMLKQKGKNNYKIYKRMIDLKVVKIRIGEAFS